MFHLLLSLVLIGVALAGDVYRGHRLVQTQATTKAELELLGSLHDNEELDLDFWTDPSLVIPTTIRVPPKSFGKLRSTLTLAGLKAEVVSEDVQSLVDKERAEMAAQRSRMQPSLHDYRTTYLNFEEIVNKLLEFRDTFPSTMKLWTAVYKTQEDRDLLFAEISSDFSGTKPAIWIEATTHAREWVTASTALYMIELLASGATAEARTLLEKFDWFIMPVHNPDGYAYTHNSTGYRYWRKNRAKSQRCGNTLGVDLNRNWDANFGGSGSSGTCSSDTYRGSAALSEVETLAVHNIIESYGDRVKAFFSIHCFSQLLLLPYAYGVRSSDYEELLTIANAAMTSLRQVHGTKFTVGAASEVLYAASGGAYDHAKLNLGIKYSYTYELRPASGSLSGFHLDPKQINEVQEETWASMVTFADMIYDRV